MLISTKRLNRGEALLWEGALNRRFAVFQRKKILPGFLVSSIIMAPINKKNTVNILLIMAETLPMVEIYVYWNIYISPLCFLNLTMGFVYYNNPWSSWSDVTCVKFNKKKKVHDKKSNITIFLRRIQILQISPNPR